MPARPLPSMPEKPISCDATVSCGYERRVVGDTVMPGRLSLEIRLPCSPETSRAIQTKPAVPVSLSCKLALVHVEDRRELVATSAGCLIASGEAEMSAADSLIARVSPLRSVIVPRGAATVCGWRPSSSLACRSSRCTVVISAARAQAAPNRRMTTSPEDAQTPVLGHGVVTPDCVVAAVPVVAVLVCAGGRRSRRRRGDAPDRVDRALAERACRTLGDLRAVAGGEVGHVDRVGLDELLAGGFVIDLGARDERADPLLLRHRRLLQLRDAAEVAADLFVHLRDADLRATIAPTVRTIATSAERTRPTC